MRVLGLYDDHNCGASIVEDGKVLAAIEEERLSRIKLHSGTGKDGPPIRSLTKVLEMTGSDRINIDKIALALASPGQLQSYVLRDLFKTQKNFKWAFASLLGNPKWDPYHLFYPYFYQKFRIRKLKKLLVQFDLHDIPIVLVDHHKSHAASAYYTGGRSKATIVTLDGQGDGQSGTVFNGENGELTRKMDVPSYHSIGLFYNFITWLLGYKPNRHEGKITGLAAYGNPRLVDEFYDGLFSIKGTEFSYDLARKIYQHPYPHRSNYPEFKKAIEDRIDGFEPKEIAAGIQDISERVVTEFIRNVMNGGEEVDITMAGGVFANVKINQRVAEIDGVDSVFIFPAMGDGGLSTGAALYAYYQDVKFGTDYNEIPRLNDVYFGPEYTDKEIQAELDKENLKYTYYPNVEKEIAKILSEGNVVARFNGRMEFGPRALGNRSILYQTTDPTVNDWLNEKLNRTEFMPFAPVTCVEDANDCYIDVGENEYPARFMTITFDCTETMGKQSPAVVHVDNTARPQLVSEENNQSYYRIIKEYKKLTGIPSIINTSFNMHEEPIVCSPHDAIRAFKLGHLECLAIGNFIVTSPDKN